MSWQRSFWVMVGIQTLSVGAYYFALPFIPFQVEEFGIRDPKAVAVWSGIIFSINALAGASMSGLSSWWG